MGLGSVEWALGLIIVIFRQLFSQMQQYVAMIPFRHSGSGRSGVNFWKYHICWMPQLLPALGHSITDKSSICLSFLTTHLERHYLKSSLLHVPFTIILTFKDLASAAGSGIKLKVWTGAHIALTVSKHDLYPTWAMFRWWWTIWSSFFLSQICGDGSQNKVLKTGSYRNPFHGHFYRSN